MFLILAFTLFSSNTIASIRDQIRKNQFKSAFQASNSKIKQQGVKSADHILFFLRGYASIKIENYDQGISDLSHFLAANKSITQQDKVESISLLCLAYLKTGRIDKALRDSTKIKNKTLINLIQKANSLHKEITSTSSPNFLLKKYEELIKICPFSENFTFEAANIALSTGDNKLFVDILNKALFKMPKNSKIFEKIIRFHFAQMEFKKAEENAKKCIKSVDDSTNCTFMLKSIKEFQKNDKKALNFLTKKNFDEAKKIVEKCQPISKKYSSEESPLSNHINKIKVAIFIGKNEKEEAVECLNGLIKNFPENNEFLVQRGQILLDYSDFSGAIADFQTVKERTKPNSVENKEAIKFIEKAVELEEKEKNMNYYTILGLKSDAKLNDVKSAYRKLVVSWHPDRFNKPLKKKEAEKKMMMINKAYEVLSDETKKKLYDFDIEYERSTKAYSKKQKTNNNYENKRSNTNKKKSEKMGKDVSKDFKEMGKDLSNDFNEIGKDLSNDFKNKKNEFNDVEIELKNIENGLKKYGK